MTIFTEGKRTIKARLLLEAALGDVHLGRRFNATTSLICAILLMYKTMMPAAENQIVVCQPNETVRLDVRLEKETVWLKKCCHFENVAVTRGLV